MLFGGECDPVITRIGDIQRVRWRPEPWMDEFIISLFTPFGWVWGGTGTGWGGVPTCLSDTKRTEDRRENHFGETPNHKDHGFKASFSGFFHMSSLSSQCMRSVWGNFQIGTPL